MKKHFNKALFLITLMLFAAGCEGNKTIDEIFEVDNQGDREGDRGSDNLKSPSEKESDQNLEVTNKKNETRLSTFWLLVS